VTPDDPATPDVRTLASGVIYSDAWIRLRKDEIERQDGSRGNYAFIEKPDFALVIPADSDGFHLVEEYRYPIGSAAQLVLPAGRFPAWRVRNAGGARRARARAGNGARARAS